MSDNKMFSRSKLTELIQELEHIDRKLKNGLARRKVVVKKIVSNITIGNNDMINLFKEMVQLYEFPDTDLEMKRMLCFYYTAYSYAKPELGSRLLDLLYRELHSGPEKALALKTISTINLELPKLIDTVGQILTSGSESPQIMEKACFAVARIFEFDSKLASENGLLKLLNDQLYNQNTVIVTTLLLLLNDITERNPTLQLRINKEHALNLIDSISKCNEWSVVYILNSLMSFVPQTNDELLLIIDKVLPVLQHGNSSVVLNLLKVIIYNCNYAISPGEVIPTLSKRLGNALISMLSRPLEIQFLVLRNIILLLLSKPELVEFDIRMFFCKYDDPIYVKDTKLEIIYLLADESNILVVLEELEEYATEVDIQMSRKLIRAIGNLAVKLDSCHLQCILVLDQLISNGVSYIVQEGAIVLKNILRKYQTGFDDVISNLINYVHMIDEPESKQSLIWIVGNHCLVIPKLDVLLEEFGETFEEEPLEFQLLFLTAIVKYYLKFRTKESSEICVKYLKIATELVNNPDLRERGFFYWRLISSSQLELSFPVVNATLPVISTENEKLDESILEELELNIGSLASIYLKPVAQVFRLAKLKKLTYSEALQPRTIGQLKPQPQRKIQTAMVSPIPDENGRGGFEDYITEPLRKDFDAMTRHSGNRSGSKLGRKLSLSFKKMSK